MSIFLTLPACCVAGSGGSPVRSSLTGAKGQLFYKPIIARTFGAVTHAMFPVAPQRDADSDVLAMTGMDTLELVSRLQRSDLDPATLDALRIMADRLCSEYPFMPP